MDKTLIIRRVLWSGQRRHEKPHKGCFEYDCKIKLDDKREVTSVILGKYQVLYAVINGEEVDIDKLTDNEVAKIDKALE